MSGDFVLELEVRDYECDMQGIVNDAVCLNYLERARHVFMKSRGLDFAETTRRSVHLVFVRAEVDYLHPLRGGDRFRVSVRVERVSPLRIDFLQEIRRLPDEKPILRARSIGAALNEKGRPIKFEEIERLL